MILCEDSASIFKEFFYFCGFGCIDYIIWCNWLILFVLGSNWLLDSQNYYRHSSKLSHMPMQKRNLVC